MTAKQVKLFNGANYVTKDDSQAVRLYLLVDLFPRIEKQVNLNFTVTSDDFENLFAPIEVDFIGINGVPVAGQNIDFEKKHYFLENDVTRFVSLTKAIELDVKDAGKYYILGREPQKTSDKNHQL